MREIGTGSGLRAQRARLLLALLLPLKFGCSDSSSPVACTTEFVPGISVKVLEGDTGHPAAYSSTVWIVDGDYSEVGDTFCIQSRADSLQSPWVNGAYERPGTYTVLVVRDGYEPWSRSGVVVTANECHVERVMLEAVLLPSRWLLVNDGGK